MISVRIGNTERKIEDAGETWVNQEINRRQSDGQSVCVRITIKEGDLDMALSTPNCPMGGGGRGRMPNGHEQAVFDLWDKLGLNSGRFSGGQVVAFLKQLRRLR